VLLALAGLPRSDQLTCPAPGRSYSKINRYLYPCIRTTCACQLLPHFCWKMTQFVPHGWKRQGPGWAIVWLM